MKSGLLLDVVVGQSPTILKLFSSKDQTLLIWRDTFLVLDLSFDILDGIRGFDLKGDGLAGQSFHEDLHASSQSQDQVKGTLLLDVVVGQSPTILKLFSSKDQTLLIWRDTFLVLNLSLDIFNGIRGFDLKGDGLTGQSFHENLHFLIESLRV